MCYDLDYYELLNGKQPAKDFIDSLPLMLKSQGVKVITASGNEREFTPRA